MSTLIARGAAAFGCVVVELALFWGGCKGKPARNSLHVQNVSTQKIAFSESVPYTVYPEIEHLLGDRS